MVEYHVTNSEWLWRFYFAANRWTGKRRLSSSTSRSRKATWICTLHYWKYEVWENWMFELDECWLQSNVCSVCIDHWTDEIKTTQRNHICWSEGIERERDGPFRWIWVLWLLLLTKQIDWVIRDLNWRDYSRCYWEIRDASMLRSAPLSRLYLEVGWMIITPIAVIVYSCKERSMEDSCWCESIGWWWISYWLCLTCCCYCTPTLLSSRCYCTSWMY